MGKIAGRIIRLVCAVLTTRTVISRHTQPPTHIKKRNHYCYYTLIPLVSDNSVLTKVSAETQKHKDTARMKWDRSNQHSKAYRQTNVREIKVKHKWERLLQSGIIDILGLLIWLHYQHLELQRWLWNQLQRILRDFQFLKYPIFVICLKYYTSYVRQNTFKSEHTTRNPLNRHIKERNWNS